MPVKCQTILTALEELAPARLASGWDNVGLLTGDPEQLVSRVLVCLDVTPEVAEAAAAGGVDLIVAHHPLFLKGPSTLRADRPLGRTLAVLIRAGIAVFAAHTNWDAVPGGVNDILAARLGLERLRPLTVEQREKLLKLAVFVPADHAEAVRQAMADAGAGHIGNYSHCTFQTAGTGTFLPLAGTSPFIGQQGRLEYVDELRLETILPETIAPRVLKAMLAAHPYEEAAYDLYSLANEGQPFGVGRVGEITPLAAADFALRVKTALSLGQVKVSGPTDKQVKVVAVCGGSGASLVSDAVRVGADVLVTGDVKYHDALEAADRGLVIIDAGHFATERPAMDAVAAYLSARSEQAGWAVAVVSDQLSRDIFSYY